MQKDSLYNRLLDQLISADILHPDLPDETAETTLKALWNTAAGHPCSAQKTQTTALSILSEDKQLVLQHLVNQRCKGIPLAYLTHRIHFMGLELQYEPGVVIPRPETEILANSALEVITCLYSGLKKIIGIDIGCGSGNISCVLGKRQPALQLFSIDITSECIALTRKNVAAFNLEKQISIYQGDLFSPLKEYNLDGQIDFIVSNPPYIPAMKLQSTHAHLLSHEPREAFDGGVYGFSLHQRLIKESLTMLKHDGFLLFEFGLGQEKQVVALFSRVKGYTPVRFASDILGNPRVAIAQKI